MRKCNLLVADGLDRIFWNCEYRLERGSSAVSFQFSFSTCFRKEKSKMPSSFEQVKSDCVQTEVLPNVEILRKRNILPVSDEQIYKVGEILY